MRAWQLDNSLAKPTLFLKELPQPKPGPNEILIRIHAVGITPTELLWYPTSHTKAGEKRNKTILGHEFSGTIAAMGKNINALDTIIGQDIYGMNDWFIDGATAEYCLTQPEWIAPKPRRLTHIEAASIPIGALTAWQGLFDHLKLKRGERILIHGGSGAVGIFAIQFARHWGAQIITTASERNRDFLLELGAQQVIDYHTARFEDCLTGIDAVFDTVGGDTLQRSWNILSPQGRLVTVAAESENTSDERTKKAFFIVEPNQKQLFSIGDLLETGAIKPVINAAVPFAQADLAYTDIIAKQQGRGKAVVLVTD